MKDEKAVVKECAEKIIQDMGGFDYEIKSFLEQMKTAKTISELMLLKKDLFREIIQALPLGTSHCPFCILNDFVNSHCSTECTNCFYGKEKGICSLHNDSHYSEIKHALAKLGDLLHDYWDSDMDKKWEELSKPKITQVTSELELICGNKYFTTYNVRCSDEDKVPIEEIFTAASIPYQYIKGDSVLNGSLIVDCEEEKCWAKDGIYKGPLLLQDLGIPKSKYSDRRTWTYDESVKNMTWGELKKLIKF